MTDGRGSRVRSFNSARTDIKQRFNVAASRARDQMWVVHSVDPATDLKPGDLRRMLLEHCLSAATPSPEGDALRSKLESPFEEAVYDRLVRLGYRVTPQWIVGHYRIDMVVEGNGKRLAIECDGDRYHPLEKLADDMSRQATLERLGWRFVRIRSSAFFRAPDDAMRPVFKRLQSLGIEPSAERPVAAGLPALAIVDAIRRRADEIRLAWQTEQTDDDARVDERIGT